MRFWIRQLLRFVRLSFFQRRSIPASQRRGYLYCLRFLLLFFSLETLNGCCLILDHVLFPGHRRLPIRQPIFLVGNPRSGTTILHRVMALDSDRFFCFRTWEILFPSILQKRLLSLLGRLDRWLGSPGQRQIVRGEARRFEEFNRLHKTGLFLPEEDDKLLVHILACVDLAWFFPYAGFDRLARMDRDTTPDEQHQIMQFYQGCLRRQAYLRGEGRSLLSKNPAFTGRVDCLLRYFPDGKVIYLVRNPLDVVASTISLARVIVKTMVGLAPDGDLDERVYEVLKFYYTVPLERLGKLPNDRFAIVNYEDLVGDPERVIRGVYERFGLPVSAEFGQRLAEEAAAMRRYKSEHQYSLQDSPVTPERILTDLADVFDRFGFDRRAETPCRVRQVPEAGLGPPPSSGRLSIDNKEDGLPSDLDRKANRSEARV